MFAYKGELLNIAISMDIGFGKASSYSKILLMDLANI